MKKGSTRKPQCHPHRKHYAKGLCEACYNAELKKKSRKQKAESKKQQPREIHTMPAAHENEKPAAKSKDAPTTVKSDVGETEPTQVFGGDGVTPIAEWEEKYAELKKKQAEKDAERREKAAKEEEAGNVMTTAKGK